MGSGGHSKRWGIDGYDKLLKHYCASLACQNVILPPAHAPPFRLKVHGY